MHLSWILGGKGLMIRRTFPHLTSRGDLLFAGSQNSPSHVQGAALGGFCGIQEAGLVVHQLPAPPCSSRQQLVHYMMNVEEVELI